MPALAFYLQMGVNKILVVSRAACNIEAGVDVRKIGSSCYRKNIQKNPFA